MRSFWSDPYLWIHLAGLSAFPLLAEGCLVGFALGDPFLPAWLELLLVAAAGVVPILWMQWQRPFYIFSLVAVCLRPTALTDDQRRLLTLFKLPRNRALAVLVSIALIGMLGRVYALAPIASSSVSFLPASRLLGLLLAAAAFLACNLFVQVPLSVASVMLSGESAFTRAVLYPQEKIQQSFSLIGLQLNQMLPPVVTVTKPTISPQAAFPAATVMTDSIGSAKAPTLTEPPSDDLWADTAGVEDSPTVSTDQALEIETNITDLPDVESAETLTLLEETSTPKDTSLRDAAFEHVVSAAEEDDHAL